MRTKQVILVLETQTAKVASLNKHEEQFDLILGVTTCMDTE